MYYFCLHSNVKVNSKSKLVVEKKEKKKRFSNFDFELRFRVGPEVVYEFATQKEKINSSYKKNCEFKYDIFKFCVTKFL